MALITIHLLALFSIRFSVKFFITNPPTRWNNPPVLPWIEYGSMYGSPSIEYEDMILYIQMDLCMAYRVVVHMAWVARVDGNNRYSLQ